VTPARRTRSRAKTFVVRVWEPLRGEKLPPGLHGVVQRVGDDEPHTFSSAEELVRLLLEPVAPSER
jgi:hypothetical protein